MRATNDRTSRLGCRIAVNRIGQFIHLVAGASEVIWNNLIPLQDRRGGPERRHRDHSRRHGDPLLGRLHNYLRERRARRWVSLAYGDGAMPTLTLTSHPGGAPDGEPVKLDILGISQISFGAADVRRLQVTAEQGRRA